MNSTTLIAYIIAAAIPALAVYLIFLLDLFGTGKFSTVLICLGWGGLGAFTLAREINNLFVEVIGYENVTRFSAPIVEEILKAVILWYFITRPRFRYIVDGAVYGFGTGIGFAVMENFFFIGGEGAALALAISRVLSASLMHATASSMAGISLGRLRRSDKSFWQKSTWPLLGILIAMVIHAIYNNVVQIEGVAPSVLLLLGITIGIGGAVIIGVIINQGLAEEKARFAETLGLDVGVTSAERKVVQGLGTNAIEDILIELASYFGDEKVDKIRRLLVTQANIGILSNNLRTPASDRMKEAWRKEIDEKRVEVDQLRQQIGVYVMSFVRGIFPENDIKTWEAISEKAADFDPAHVHKFDAFMLASAATNTLTPEKLEELGARLKKMDIFSNVDLADLENLSRAIVERPFAHGSLLFNQGDEGDTMYMIEDGGISIFVDEQYIRTYSPGSVVGDMALFDGQRRSATARAHGNLRVLMLARQHVMMFVNSRPHVIQAVLEYLAERVRYTTHIVQDAAERASAIAQGDYEKCLRMTPLVQAPAFAGSGNGNPEAAGPMPVATTMDMRNLLSNAPQALGGAFAMLAVALEKRESQLKDQVDRAKQTR